MIEASIKRVNKTAMVIVVFIFLANLFARSHYIGRFKSVSGGDAYNNLFITQRWAKLENPFTNRRLPFYPLLLLPGHLIDEVDPIVWGRIVSAAAGAVTASLIFLIASSFGLTYGAAVFVSLLVGFSPGFFYVSLRPLSNSLYTLLVVTSIFIYYLPQSRARKILLGIILGLTAMTRHEGFLVAAVLLSLEIFLHEKKKQLKDRVLSLVPFIILILPFFINNLLVYNNIFYSSYLGSEGQIYTPNNLGDLIFNLSILKRSFLGLWFNLNRPIFQEMMIVLLVMGVFIFINRHRLSSLPIILVIISQIFVNLVFQPYSRHLHQTIPFVALMIGYGFFIPKLDIKIKTFVRKLPIKNIFAVLLIAGFLFQSNKAISKRIAANNFENKHDEYLIQGILFARDLEGKIGFSADYPQAVYYFGEKASYFAGDVPRDIDINTQLNWLIINEIDYFIWYSRHPVFSLFNQENDQLFELIETIGDEDVEVRIYKITKNNDEKS